MDVKATSLKSLQRACDIFRQDLEAIPEAAFDQSFGPKCRTVADIVYEVNFVNDHIGQTLRREKLGEWPDGWIKAPEGFRSKADVLRAYQESSERVIGTAESFAPESFETPIPTGEGETTPLDRCRFMTLHLWYHSGQLNFIQTLLGDDEWHWK